PTRSRPVHSVISREKPSKRTKEAWAESWDEARLEHPAVEAGLEHSTVEAGLEHPAVEAGLEHPAVEAGLEHPTIEARLEPASEARHDPASEGRGHSVKTPSHVLGVQLAGSPKPYQEG